MIFKVAHGKEIHMLSKQVSFSELHAFVLASFRKVPTHFALSYLDNEGDAITISSQEDLDVVYQMKVPSLKITISETNEEALKADTDEVEVISDAALKAETTEVPVPEKPVTEETLKTTLIESKEDVKINE
jgi:hypothetical protein